MIKVDGNDAKERIVNAAIRLFSKKGYDATRVSDIAGAAKVNKALIYYYFTSKENILDFMISHLLDNAVSLTVDFIQSNIVQMIQEGTLFIQPDRLHFESEEAVRRFMESAGRFCEKVVDYVLENREIIRILMSESLKQGKHQNSLFRFMKFMGGDKTEPIVRTFSKLDGGFVYSDEIILFGFFYTVIPIVSFAAYCDDYREVSGQTEERLRRAFLRVSQVVLASLVSGNDILLGDTFPFHPDQQNAV